MRSGRPLLRLEQPGGRGRIVRTRGDPVHGVGREHDQLAAPRGGDRVCDGVTAHGRRPDTTRSRPLRSVRTRDVDEPRRLGRGPGSPPPARRRSRRRPRHRRTAIERHRRRGARTARHRRRAADVRVGAHVARERVASPAARTAGSRRRDRPLREARRASLEQIALLDRHGEGRAASRSRVPARRPRRRCPSRTRARRVLVARSRARSRPSPGADVDRRSGVDRRTARSATSTSGLGLGPRHEHARTHLEHESAERLLPRQVLQRRARAPTTQRASVAPWPRPCSGPSPRVNSPARSMSRIRSRSASASTAAGRRRRRAVPR